MQRQTPLMRSVGQLFNCIKGAGPLAFLLLLSLISCAAPDGQPSRVPSASQAKTLTEIDLTDANRDTRKFLSGTTLLGRSLTEDLNLLQKLTGERFKPEQEPGIFSEGEKRYRAFVAYFPETPMLINGTFAYQIPRVGRYQSSTHLVFNQKVVCITAEDLEAVFGRPTRIISAGEIPAVGLGPSYIWTVVYVYPSGSKSLFQFSTSNCMNDMTHSSSSPEVSR